MKIVASIVEPGLASSKALTMAAVVWSTGLHDRNVTVLLAPLLVAAVLGEEEPAHAVRLRALTAARTVRVNDFE
ncbi:hypothetical protein GCM10009818_35890 [Nakamurella flavida]